MWIMAIVVLFNSRLKLPIRALLVAVKHKQIWWVPSTWYFLFLKFKGFITLLNVRCLQLLQKKNTQIKMRKREMCVELSLLGSCLHCMPWLTSDTNIFLRQFFTPITVNFTPNFNTILPHTYL